MSQRLIVFAKNPIYGKVKTRLAVGIGHKKALKVYQQLLNHTLSVVEKSRLFTVLYFSDHAESSEKWQNYAQQIQHGANLGQRMCHAFQTAFQEGKEKVVIIGTDCFDIDEETIRSAFLALDNCDVVIGPAEDGGYYLLGMKQLHERLFVGKKWSTETVFIDTIEDIKLLGLTHKTLPTLADIDTEEALKKHEGKIDLTNG